ncbi:hypothetical protein [Mycolicibacterium helvum]|uniref:hypothetical protein n=1 Tax=Mycolicibacterium helvum TaxID=1534349 RepID=UPI0013D0351C|nr:hypothetical protein [Mycolicibacterium helvum]
MLFVVALALILATTAGIARADSVEAKRLIYWLGWMSAVACAAVSLLPLGLKTTVITFVGFAFAVVFWAWLTTPYLKIGRRTFALTMADRRSGQGPDSGEDAPAQLPANHYPGPVTAGTVWWIFAILTTAAGVGVYLGGWRWQTITVAVVLTALGAISGLDDASRALGPARGQHVQAAVIAVASILLWLAPIAAYAIGYTIGLRHATGRDSGPRSLDHGS